jgi:hypothetical protein
MMLSTQPATPCLGCMGAVKKPQLALGDLSFDGTGLLGSGLFGYNPWYDTSQWTILEWAAIAAAGLYASKLYRGVGSWKRKRARRRRN